MKVLSFAATNHTKSINRQLIGYATKRIQDLNSSAEINILDINDFEMPIYSQEREQASGVPSQAKSFFDAIGEADAVVVSFAEHNGFVTAAWKNIFDWMSRIDQNVWQNKPLVFLCASPGGRAGAGVLESQEKNAPHFAGEVKGIYGVGKWGESWDGEELTNPADIEGVENALKGLLS